ncbi:hypothetical protein NEUTE1DRAFT_52208, partial [Neurospora tetrasperma FGSC 2508]
LYRPGINYRIKIKKGPNSKEFPLAIGLLYNITYKEFLILKKILKNLLNKGFIRANNSEADTLILIIKKPGGGLRFYYNY